MAAKGMARGMDARRLATEVASEGPRFAALAPPRRPPARTPQTPPQHSSNGRGWEKPAQAGFVAAGPSGAVLTACHNVASLLFPRTAVAALIVAGHLALDDATGQRRVAVLRDGSGRLAWRHHWHRT